MKPRRGPRMRGYMKPGVAEIKAKGKIIKVPWARILDKPVIVTGRMIRTARIQDEDWFQGQIDDPEAFVGALNQDLKADIFTFSQRLPDTEPKYDYYKEWDNVAAIRITTYEDWWEKQLPQVTRKSVRRGAKRGVSASVTPFTDDLVRGIISVHNDTPTRQGVPFYHYGKDFSLVKREYGTYLDRSEFIGAYYENDLIGIIKMVHMGGSANIMQIVTMTKHYDKRPTNILIAKAVEVCAQKQVPFLMYGKYIYGNKTDSTLTEFKRRNAFEKIDLPRYYIPLTMKGRMAIRLNLHRGLLGILPNAAIHFLLKARSRYHQVGLRLSQRSSTPRTEQQQEEEE